MKKLINKFCWILVFLCAVLQGRAQETAFTAKADSLFSMGRYADAAMEYERAAFLYPFDSNVNVCLLMKSRAQKYNQDYKGALQSLQRINSAILPEHLKYETAYEKILCAYLAADHNLVLHEINEMRTELHDSALLNKTLYIEILSLCELQMWLQAKNRFREYASIKNSGLNADSVFSFADKPKHKNLRLAKAMSALIPGSGLMYAGKPGKGLLQLGLFAGFAAFGIYSIQHEYYISGILSGLMPSYLFYSGGLRNTSFYIHQKNDRINSAYNERIKRCILSIEKTTLL